MRTTVMTWQAISSITIDAVPVPYMRTTQRAKFEPRYKRYAASQKTIQWLMKAAIIDHFWPKIDSKQPLGVEIQFAGVDRMHCKDIDNMAKAVLDAGNKILWPDDRWIDHLYIDRKTEGDPETKISIFVEE